MDEGKPRKRKNEEKPARSEGKFFSSVQLIKEKNKLISQNKINHIQCLCFFLL